MKKFLKGFLYGGLMVSSCGAPVTFGNTVMDAFNHDGRTVSQEQEEATKLVAKPEFNGAAFKSYSRNWPGDRLTYISKNGHEETRIIVECEARKACEIKSIRKGLAL